MGAVVIEPISDYMVAAQNATNPAAATNENIYYVTSDALNVRATPSSNGKLVGKLTHNQKVTMLEKQGYWGKIKINGQTGWVSVKYLSNREITKTSSEKTPVVVYIIAGIVALGMIGKLFRGGSKDEDIADSSTAQVTNFEPIKINSEPIKPKIIMKNYQCIKCGVILKSVSTPNFYGCTADGNYHNWNDLGEVGGRNYQCKKCGILIQSEHTPNFDRCTADGNYHNWNDLGKVGDNSYQCKKCGLIVQSERTPNSYGCTADGNYHNWIKM
jgi:hypothetical protein